VERSSPFVVLGEKDLDMPDTNHFTGLPVPLDGEASNGPEDFAAFRDALAGHTVVFATTEANRDALYADAPVGTICSSTTTKTVWRKAAMPNTWDTIFHDSGWVSLAGASWGDSWSDNGSVYRILNERVTIDLRAVYNGDPVGSGDGTGSGNMANQVILTLPSEIQPGGEGPAHIPFLIDYAGMAGFGTIFKSSSNLDFCAVHPWQTLETGTAVFAYLTYFVS
jgi:hypothetical protein